MEDAPWWSKLPSATRAWLVANNGDRVPAHIVRQIRQAGGPAPSDPGPTDEGQASDSYFSDEVIDWIEAVGNDE